MSQAQVRVGTFWVNHMHPPATQIFVVPSPVAQALDQPQVRDHLSDQQREANAKHNLVAGVSLHWQLATGNLQLRQLPSPRTSLVDDTGIHENTLPQRHLHDEVHHELNGHPVLRFPTERTLTARPDSLARQPLPPSLTGLDDKAATMAQAVNRIRGAFAPPRKGETFELRAGLVSQYAYERKESIQKTIMAMTLGKDVSALFPDVLKNIATPDLDQKKLVYLYLMLVDLPGPTGPFALALV